MQVLSKSFQENTFEGEKKTENDFKYQTFRDGSHYQNNKFFSVEENRVSLILYVDDFEVCNPLGTSRKKHKVTAVYWVLGNIPVQLRSTLTSIYLAILCKAEDTKQFGFQRVLEPLLTDIQSLEKDFLFVPALGKAIKGTVVSVVADNLGAHSVAGFVESFAGSYICRFCVGERSKFQSNEVRSGSFHQRTKDQHTLHVQTAVSSPDHPHCYGVKKQCALSEKLEHFHVTSGYPPDVLHDLL